MNPNSPHADAGARIEPPPSLACASGTIPAATAAAAPPDDPAAERDRSQGLCVAPSSSVSVLQSRPSSETAVLPTVTRPLAAVRAPKGVPALATLRPNSLDPI